MRQSDRFGSITSTESFRALLQVLHINHLTNESKFSHTSPYLADIEIAEIPCITGQFCWHAWRLGVMLCLGRASVRLKICVHISGVEGDSLPGSVGVDGWCL